MKLSKHLLLTLAQLQTAIDDSYKTAARKRANDPDIPDWFNYGSEYYQGLGDAVCVAIEILLLNAKAYRGYQNVERQYTLANGETITYFVKQYLF